MLHVLIVDDHPVVREGLKRMLGENIQQLVAAEAADGEKALEAVRSDSCDVVLLDISLPKKSGLEVLKDIHAERPRLPILVLSIHPEDDYALPMLRAGASGYLTKDAASEKLVSAIWKVVSGGRYISPRLGERLALNLGHDAEKPAHELLSNREYQVLCMLSNGKTVGDIATELSLSVKTISTYRTRVLEKLSLRNNAELIRYAIKQELVVS